MNSTALIVAAGMSSRMGAFKPLLPLNGTTFIGNIINNFLLAGIESFIIVTGNNSDQLRSSIDRGGIRFVHNEHYETTDMFTSVKLGLESSGDANIFFTTADSPVFMPVSVIEMQKRIHERSVRNPIHNRVLIPSYNGMKGHPVFIPNDEKGRILAYNGNKGLRDAIGSEYEIIELPDPGVAMDADTPEEYELMKSYIESSQPFGKR